MASKDKTLAIILGGGRGARLHPLTKMRAKPAVPLGGSYRLIDVPISNCINSKISRIFILTQYNSASLNRHISQSYSFDVFRGGFVEILAAEQTITNSGWYQGTADAVRQNICHATPYDYDYYLILAGDHLYQMNYQKFLEHHIRKNADITVATNPVVMSEASEFGIMKIDESLRITEFFEKPTDESLLKELKISVKIKSMFRNEKTESKKGDLLASMGIYIFKKKVLHEILEDNSKSDFGKDIIPNSLKNYKVFAFPFNGYWQDIGTIRSFFEANLALSGPNPPFKFYTPKGVIYSRPRFLSGTRISDSNINNTLISSGSNIIGAKLDECIIGIRSVINKGTVLKKVVVMGADESGAEGIIESKIKKGIPNSGIGTNCKIHNAIIDKNARIGNNVIIKNLKNLETFDGKGYSIRDRIVIVEKNAIIPSGTVI